MKQIRLTCRTAQVYGGFKNKVGFDIHNGRKEELKKDQKINYTPELSKDNVVYKNGNVIPNDQFDELVKLIKDENKASIKSSKGDMSEQKTAKLNLSRSKTKAKINKWIENSTDINESMFFADILEKIGNEEIDSKTEIKKLKSFGKVKRLNNKINAIQDLESCNELLKVTENNSLSLKVISSEKMFKIPDQWETNIKPEDWNTIISGFHNKYYKNFEAYYTAIHCDENPDNPHAHHRMSGFNQKTKSFDLPDHELNLVRRLFKKENQPELYQGKKWSQLDPEEVKDFGEKYQTFLFAYCNNQFQKLGYEVKAVKRTPEEKAKNPHVYSRSKISDRVFNGANKLQEKVENWIVNLSINIKTAIGIHVSISDEKAEMGKELLNDVDKLLDKEKANKYKKNYDEATKYR